MGPSDATFTWLKSAVAAMVVLVAACGADDDAPDTTAAEPDPAATAVEDPTDSDDVDQSQADAALADLDLSPDDGWAEDHWDVEVPVEPGTAVLVIAGERLELYGDCGLDGAMHLADVPEEERAQLRERVGFFAAEGVFETRDRSPQLVVRVNRRYGYQLPDVPGLVRDHVEVHLDAVRGGNTNYATRVDGTLVTSNPQSDKSSDEAQSFVRIDPTGVFTAVGTIAQSNDPDSPTGDFELGARCDDGWVERISAG